MKILELISEDPKKINYIYVIAEAGINHNGDINIAKELIRQAAEVGCDAVKFQKRTIEVVYSQEELKKERLSPWGTTQGEQKKGLEFSTSQYMELKSFADSLNIAFSASAWDEESLEFIESLNPQFHKVASAFIVNEKFLRKVAGYKRPTLISTGMCEEIDITNAVNIFRETGCPFMLLHSVSTYPAEIANLNLNYIKSMLEKFNVGIGYSGHESAVSPSIVAAALGAKVIERHFTLDRSMYGSDQSASLEIEGLRRLVAGLRKLPTTLGTGKKVFLETEKQVARKLRYWENE